MPPLDLLMNTPNMYKFNYQMESVIDLDFLDACQIISISNQNLLCQLLKHNFISYSQLKFQILKLCRNLCLVPIERDHFTYVLNSLITLFLKNLVNKSLIPRFSKKSLSSVSDSSSTKSDVKGKIMSGLHNCFLQNFCYKSFIDPVHIEHIAFNNLDENGHVKSKNKAIVHTSKRKLNVLAYTNLKPFLLFFDQGYSKSTEGDNSYSISCGDNLKVKNNVLNQINDFSVTYKISPKSKEINGKNNLSQHLNNLMTTFSQNGSDNSVLKSYNVYQKSCKQKQLQKNQQNVTVNNFFKINTVGHLEERVYHVTEKCKTFKESSFIENSYSKRSYILQNYIYNESESDSDTCIQKKSSKKRYLKNNRRKLALDYSLKVLDRVKKNVYFEQSLNDSDSEDNLVFSDSFASHGHIKRKNCIINTYNKQKLHRDLVNKNESSSDDSITFFENSINEKSDAGKIQKISVNYSDESESDDSIIFSGNSTQNNSGKSQENIRSDLVNDDESSSDDSITFSENFNDESESDDSIIFSENSTQNNSGKSQNIHCDLVNNNESSSDDSIIFSENCVTNKSDAGKMRKFSVNFNDESENDDSIIFSENSTQNNSGKSENIHCDLVNNDESSSDDSITFSENCANYKFDAGKMWKISVNFNEESESEDSIIFSENCTKNFLNHSFKSNRDDECSISENAHNSPINTDSGMKNCLKTIKFDKFIISDDDDSASNSDSSGSFDLTDFNFKAHDFPKNREQSDDFFSSTCYDNICFEDNDFLLEFDYIRNINTNWDNNMRDVPDKPREAKRVSFLPLPDLVSVHEFEPDNDGYQYSLFVLDQMRFRNRIKDFEIVMEPYLTSGHRAKFYQKYYTCDK